MINELLTYLENWTQRAHVALAQESNLVRGAELNALLTRVEKLKLELETTDERQKADVGGARGQH